MVPRAIGRFTAPTLLVLVLVAIAAPAGATPKPERIPIAELHRELDAATAPAAGRYVGVVYPNNPIYVLVVAGFKTTLSVPMFPTVELGIEPHLVEVELDGAGTATLVRVVGHDEAPIDVQAAFVAGTTGLAAWEAANKATVDAAFKRALPAARLPKGVTPSETSELVLWSNWSAARRELRVIVEEKRSRSYTTHSDVTEVHHCPKNAPCLPPRTTRTIETLSARIDVGIEIDLDDHGKVLARRIALDKLPVQRESLSGLLLSSGEIERSGIPTVTVEPETP